MSQLQNHDYWKIIEGKFGEMLVGQDGDVMFEASTWKRIQEKLNGKLTTSIWLIFSEDNSNNLIYKIHNLTELILMCCKFNIQYD